MDANFSNPVNENVTFCPQCGAKNHADSRFCLSCGQELNAAAEAAPAFAPVAEEAPSADISSSSPAFASVEEPAVEDISSSTPAFAAAEETAAQSAPAFAAVEEVKSVSYEEPKSAFAEGLPSWTIEPPQVMVRRH